MLSMHDEWKPNMDLKLKSKSDMNINEPKVVIRKEVSDSKLKSEDYLKEFTDDNTKSVTSVVNYIKETYESLAAKQDVHNRKQIIELETEKAEREAELLKLKNAYIDLQVQYNLKEMECSKLKRENQFHCEKSLRGFEFATFSPNVPILFGSDIHQMKTPFLRNNRPMPVVVREFGGGRTTTIAKRVSKMDSSSNLPSMKKQRYEDTPTQYQIIDCPAITKSRKKKTLFGKIKLGLKKIRA